MKKILFASAASLALSAGVASAQNITFAGDARMGVVYNSANVAPVAKTQFSARARMTITMKRTTDSGMEVGASFRVDNAGVSAGTATDPGGSQVGVAVTGAATGNTAMTGGSVYISGDFGKITMGDVAGAVEGVVGNLPNIGFSELRTGPTWLSNNRDRRTAVRYEYTFDGFTVMLSSDQLSTGATKTGYAGIGVKYTFDGITLSLGHETGKNAGNKDSHTMIGAEAKIDMVTLKALYGERNNNGAKSKQWGVSANAVFDATTVTGYYMKTLTDTKSYGIGAAYSLGGGASLRGAVNQSKTAAGVKTNTADFGITMSF
jgi:outer membrane protein OmpU